MTMNFWGLFFSDWQNIFRSDKIFMSVSPNDWQLLSKFREVWENYWVQDLCILNFFSQKVWYAVCVHKDTQFSEIIGFRTLNLIMHLGKSEHQPKNESHKSPYFTVHLL